MSKSQSNYTHSNIHIPEKISLEHQIAILCDCLSKYNQQNKILQVWFGDAHIRVDMTKLSSNENSLTFNGMNINHSSDPKVYDFSLKNARETNEYSTQVCALAREVITRNTLGVAIIKFNINSHKIALEDFMSLTDAIINNNTLKEIHLSFIGWDNIPLLNEFYNNCKGNKKLEIYAKTYKVVQDTIILHPTNEEIKLGEENLDQGTTVKQQVVNVGSPAELAGVVTFVLPE